MAVIGTWYVGNTLLHLRLPGEWFDSTCRHLTIKLTGAVFTYRVAPCYTRILGET